MRNVQKVSGKLGRGAGTQNPGSGGTANAAANPNQAQTGAPSWVGPGVTLPTRPAKPVTDPMGVQVSRNGKITDPTNLGPGQDAYLDQPPYQP
jgi:hypothetical protein